MLHIFSRLHGLTLKRSEWSGLSTTSGEVRGEIQDLLQQRNGVLTANDNDDDEEEQDEEQEDEEDEEDQYDEAAASVSELFLVNIVNCYCCDCMYVCMYVCISHFNPAQQGITAVPIDQIDISDVIISNPSELLFVQISDIYQEFLRVFITSALFRPYPMLYPSHAPCRSALAISGTDQHVFTDFDAFDDE